MNHKHCRRFFAFIILFSAFRAEAADRPWTLAVMGDQQFAVTQKYGHDWLDRFTSQTKWLADNAKPINLRMVAQVGDIVETSGEQSEWDRASAGMKVLDQATNADGGVGIPWCVAYGNHEIVGVKLNPTTDPAGAESSATYRRYFGSANGRHRYANQSEFKGVSKNDLNTWHIIKSSNDAGARSYLVLNLELDVPGQKKDTNFDAIEWAQSVMNDHRAMPTIIVTHVFEGSKFGPPKKAYLKGFGHNSQLEIFDKLVDKNPQVLLVLSGHTSEDTHQIRKNAKGQPVLQIVTDYTKWLGDGGDGYFRLLEINEPANEIRVKTYSAFLNKYRTDENSQFTVPLDFTTRFAALNSRSAGNSSQVKAVVASPAIDRQKPRFILAANSSATRGAAVDWRTNSIDALCTQFQGFDQNHDGNPEIQELHRIGGAGDSGQRVLMLVEQRLLEPLAGSAALQPLTQRWADDVGADGYSTDVVSVKLAKSKVHQDGRFILALREFLRAADHQKKLAGVVLVGHFPDAFLVRTCNWRRSGDLTLHKKTPQEKSYKAATYLRRAPEAIAPRADIVLGDLDGRWEDIYVQPKTSLESVVAVFAEKIPPGGGPCLDVEKSTRDYEDFFQISDNDVEVLQAGAAGREGAGPSVTIVDNVGNHECADTDRALANPIARPDILVSRLDARGVALSPNPRIIGTNRGKLLDSQGKPQAIQLAAPPKTKLSSDAFWQADPQLERQLLAEYFERNHSYRTGHAKIAWRPASLACALGSGYRYLRPAATNWEPGDPKLADIYGNPSLVDVVDWIRYPAILRTVRAHSNPQVSMFGKTDSAQLDAHLGGPAWAWTQKEGRYEPSLASACGGKFLNWYLLHSLWENGQIPPEPCFYEHGGCEAISPIGADKLPYDHPAYGKRQGAESLLLFGNGLTLLGRAKVFYDEPSGFAQTLRDGKPFGETWATYYRNESAGNGGGGEIGRKRAYFWSVLGDWTLSSARLRPSN